MNGWMWIAVGIVAIIAFYTDHTRMIIPNWLTLSAAAAGVALHAVDAGWDGLKVSLVGLVGSFLITFIIYLCKGLAAGDVKLFASFGALGGLEFSFTGLVNSLVIAALVGTCILIMRRMRREPSADAGGNGKTRIEFPFMYAVLPGLILTYVTMEVVI